MSAYVTILPSRSNATRPAIDATSAAALAHAHRTTTPWRSSPRQISRDRTAAKAPMPSAGAQKFMRCQKASVACTGGGMAGRRSDGRVGRTPPNATTAQNAT